MGNMPRIKCHNGHNLKGDPTVSARACCLRAHMIRDEGAQNAPKVLRFEEKRKEERAKRRSQNS